MGTEFIDRSENIYKALAVTDNAVVHLALTRVSSV